MSIFDIINPWGALRRSRADVAYLQDEFLKERSANERANERAAEANNRADQHSLTALARANEIARLRRLMADSHYRDPKTGVIGKKGVFPQ